MEPPRRSLGTVAAGMVLTGVSNRWWQNGKAASWRLPTMGFLRAPVIADLLQVSSELGRKARPLSCQWLCSEVHAIRHQGVVVRYALKAAALLGQ